MFTFLKNSSKKSIPIEQKPRILEQKASFTHIPLHSEIKVHVDAKLPWITKETIVESNSQPYDYLNHISTASPFSTDKTFESSGSFLDEFKKDPDFNMDINEIEIPLSDKRIFMKDVLFDESLLDSNTQSFNEPIEVVNNMQPVNAKETSIFDAIAKAPSNRFTIDEDETYKDKFKETICEQPEETHLEYDTEDDNINDKKDILESESLIDQSASLAKAINEPPAELETPESTVDTVHVDEKNDKDISQLSAKNLRTESCDDDDEYDNYRNKFHTYNVNDEYIIPSYCFSVSQELDSHIWQKEIERNSVLLVKTLQDFGIESKVTRVNRGPVITLYEIQIAAGIKVNRVSNLSDDIAMALAASRVRIVAPIPGKSAVGVEIPNRSRETVTIGDIFNDSNYQKADMQLKVGLGKDILGKIVMLDLKKQPHLLIAGATGSGKSVCVNTLISSMVFNYDPDRVRFIMIDPKMVELQLYNGLPHQLTPVITEPDIAPKALKWAIYEMERRYRLLSEIHTRDIERYNQKVESYKGQSDREKLPYIVIIVDELADLMMVAPKEIENYITRIAQKARAVGIHLVLATQRPSVDVITGIIKANFPARIAFQVAQKTDSRTILDQNGAETLLGRGDMLYQSPVSSFPVRIQGAYISEDEIIDLVRHAQKYGNPHYIDIEEEVDKRETVETEGTDAEQDEMFVEAMKIIEETQKASASYLQRRLSIGYNRAARIIERMEELGYVGPQQGSKPRDVLI
ncbi:MAG: DNA translocase FtsK [Spirochaetes bacterium]|nr:DNA translocase FtsK [Spirochaetota bacterium]MBN2769292.1 DNA translocase FtsK [Spirochaetota bacterium]